MANINKIKLSGTTYNIQDLSASKSVELTQAQYDALTVKDPNTFYVITDAQGGDLSNYYTKSETSGATEISTALNAKQDTLVSGTNIKTINNESILGSGNINIQGGGGGASYSAGTGIDITNDVISVTGMVDTTTFNTYSGSVDTALSGKQDTLSAGTGIEISGNVISATGGGGGGKAISAGTNISITTGETADTINCTLPISAGTGSASVMFGQPTSTSDASGSKTITGGQWSKAYSEGAVSIGQMNEARGQWACAFGNLTNTNGKAAFACGERTQANALCAFAEGEYCSANTETSHAAGYYTNTKNKSEFSIGEYNNSVSASTTFGNSGNTLFSVGNGTADNARHNAFEIRQNGDIYLTKDGQDVKLQDQLGGGGSSYSAGTGIDITNDVISVSGVVMSSAVTSAVTSGSTDVVTSGGVYDQLGGMKIIKLTESEYAALVTKDSNTLYVVVPDPSN